MLYKGLIFLKQIMMKIFPIRPSLSQHHLTISPIVIFMPSLWLSSSDWEHGAKFLWCQEFSHLLFLFLFSHNHFIRSNFSRSLSLTDRLKKVNNCLLCFLGFFYYISLRYIYDKNLFLQFFCAVWKIIL